MTLEKTWNAPSYSPKTSRRPTAFQGTSPFPCVKTCTPRFNKHSEQKRNSQHCFFVFFYTSSWKNAYLLNSFWETRKDVPTHWSSPSEGKKGKEKKKRRIWKIVLHFHWQAILFSQCVASPIIVHWSSTFFFFLCLSQRCKYSLLSIFFNVFFLDW